MKNPLVNRKNQSTPVNWKFSILLVCQTAILAGCGDYGPDMKIQLAGKLPNQWEIVSLQINEWEVLSRTPREWRYHFTATAVPTENLYDRAGFLNNTSILKSVATKGEFESLSGTAIAIFDGGRWRTDFDFGRAAAIFQAAPETAYGKNIAIVGNPDFHEFLASAEIALKKSQEIVDNNERSLSENVSDWSTSNNALQDNFQKKKAELESEQAQLQQERLSISSNISREVWKAHTLLQTSMREKLNAHKKDHDLRTMALTQSHRATMQELQAKNRDTQNQRMSRDEQIEGRRQLREQELKIQDQYREQLDQAHKNYAIRVKETQQELEENRVKIQNDITLNATENIETSSAALREKREKQQENLAASQTDLLDQRAKFEQRASEVLGQKEELVRQHKLLEQLKTRMN